MNELQLNSLEIQIESLLQSWQQLKHENTLLRHKLARLTKERAELLDKNQRAIARVKNYWPN
ncbi:MAG: TIGR02449 family protein [Coxiellaceae bacterium]|nr:MAG: TIGR02449 family protein [Coxiellaceae bacterium]